MGGGGARSVRQVTRRVCGSGPKGLTFFAGLLGLSLVGSGAGSVLMARYIKVVNQLRDKFESFRGTVGVFTFFF